MDGWMEDSGHRSVLGVLYVRAYIYMYVCVRLSISILSMFSRYPIPKIRPSLNSVPSPTHTVSAYSIHQNSTLALVGSGPPTTQLPSSQSQSQSKRPPTKQHPEPKTEQSTITQIRSEVENVRKTLEPCVDSFLRGLSSEEEVEEGVGGEDLVSAPPATATASAPATSSVAPPQPPSQTQLQPSPQTQTQTHTRLSELLLQSLLRLDAMTPDGSWEAARAERKGAVREVQGLLDRLDGGWKSACAASVSGAGGG